MPADPDAFNTHFVGNIGPPALVYAPPIGINNNCHFDFKRVGATDVLEALASSPPSQRMHPDHSGTARGYLPDLITYWLFSEGLEAGYTVRPLPKTNSASTLSDFRPISILNATSKVLESVALHQISDFVNESNLLDDL